MSVRSVRAHVSNTNSIVTKTRTPTLEHRYWDDAMEQVLKLAENICVELKEQFNTYFHQLFPYVLFVCEVREFDSLSLM